MGFDLDATGMQDVNDAKTGNHPKPGVYHAAVASVKAVVSKKKQTPGYEIGFEILAGTIPGQEGTTITETIWITQDNLKRAIAYAMATGVLKPGTKADETILLQTEGRDLVIEAEEQTYDKDDGTKGKKIAVKYSGFWPTDHKDVATVPKNAAAIKALHSQAGAKTAQASGNGNGQQAQQQQTQAAAAGAASSNWNDV